MIKLQRVFWLLDIKKVMFPNNKDSDIKIRYMKCLKSNDEKANFWLIKSFPIPYKQYFRGILNRITSVRKEKNKQIVVLYHMEVPLPKNIPMINSVCEINVTKNPE